MAELILDYSEILDAKKAAKKAADCCEDYVEEIERKVTNKLQHIEGGESAYTSQAGAYARMKMEQLREKQKNYQNYGRALEDFVSDAKAVDKNAASTIKSSYKMYINEHNIKVNPVVEALTALQVWGGNATGFGKVVKGLYDFNHFVKENLTESLEYWYRCQGGKNVVKLVGAIALTITAVATIVVTWPALITAITGGAIWTAVVAGATVVGSIISAVNGLVDMWHEGKAIVMNADNPAKALMSSNISSASDWFKDVISESKLVNKLTMGVASVLDGVEFVCDVIGVIDVARNGINFMKNMKKDGFKGVMQRVKTGYKNSKKLTPWGKITDSINDITKNQTIKMLNNQMGSFAKNGMSLEVLNGTEKWMPSPETYNFAKKISDFKPLKYTKDICGYIDAASGGVGKIAKKEICKIDLIDKTWDVTEKISDWIKKKIA